MQSIRVERTIRAPVERVFDLLTDHDNYDRFRPVKRSRLVRQGGSDRNGVGAIRHVDVPPLHFEEEITAYERPHRLEYLITKLNIPFEHRGGRIELEPAGDTTHVVWTSSFRVPTSLVGPLAELPMAIALRRGFRRTLEDAERLAVERPAE